MALTPQEEAGIRERAAIAVAEAEAAKEKAAKSKTQAAANTIPKTSNGVQEKIQLGILKWRILIMNFFQMLLLMLK